MTTTGKTKRATKKVGRPALHGEPMASYIRVRLSAHEKQILKNITDELGISLTSFIRGTALDAAIVMLKYRSEFKQDELLGDVPANTFRAWMLKSLGLRGSQILDWEVVDLKKLEDDKTD